MRLIDADAIECDTEWSEYDDDFISYSKMEIACAPTIDAVSVVRCKECVHYQFKQKNSPYERHRRYCNRGAIMATNPDDYCSYGERESE